VVGSSAMLMPTRSVSFWPCASPGEASPNPNPTTASPIQAALIGEWCVMMFSRSVFF
jgi:hypothetical protein